MISQQTDIYEVCIHLAREPSRSGGSRLPGPPDADVRDVLLPLGETEEGLALRVSLAFGVVIVPYKVCLGLLSAERFSLFSWCSRKKGFHYEVQRRL